MVIIIVIIMDIVIVIVIIMDIVIVIVSVVGVLWSSLLEVILVTVVVMVIVVNINVLTSRLVACGSARESENRIQTKHTSNTSNRQQANQWLRTVWQTHTSKEVESLQVT